MRLIARRLDVARAAGIAIALAHPISARAETELLQGFAPRPLDGAQVRAVERVTAGSPHELSLAAGIYPFNPFSFGFEGSLGYLYALSEAWSWEVLHATYCFSVDKDLTIQLAEIGQSPQFITRLEYLAGTNLHRTLFYGKTLLGQDLIRYFRGTLLGGVGVVGTNRAVNFGGNVGLQLEVYTSADFSWKFSFRNTTAIGGDFSSYPQFFLGVGLQL